MKKILVLTSELTGYGHKNISDAIKYNFSQYTNVKVRCVEAFNFGGKMAIALSQIYNKSVGLSSGLWNLMYKIAYLSHYPLGVFVALKIERKFLDYIENYKPDFILSVHPIFVKSIALIIKKNNINIPFGVLVTDIASINKIWLDKKPDIYYCTTEETKQQCLKYGISSDKINMVKYPIGKQYSSQYVINHEKYDKEIPLKVLLLSGGDGIMDFETMARSILSNFNSQVTVVTARNKKLKSKLEAGLGKEYKGRINIYGFVNNLSEMYRIHNIALIRASPNVMFEVLTCNIPSLIVSYIPGQETDNCDFAEKHHIAIKCLDNNMLVKTIDNLTANNGQKLIEMKIKQREYLKSISYSNIEELVYNYDSYRHYIDTGQKCYWW